jgi:hypothetical protein
MSFTDLWPQWDKENANRISKAAMMDPQFGLLALVLSRIAGPGGNGTNEASETIPYPA